MKITVDTSSKRELKEAQQVIDLLLKGQLQTLKIEPAEPAVEAGELAALEAPLVSKVEADLVDTDEPKVVAVPDDETPQPAPKATEPKQPTTLDDVKAVAKEYIQSGDREQVKVALSKFQVDNVSSLEPADYDNFLATLFGGEANA